MGYEFLQSNAKFGISLDRKSFVVFTENGFDFYDSIDDFLDAWRCYIEYLIKRHEDNK